jgi:hypothetical protein
MFVARGLNRAGMLVDGADFLCAPHGGGSTVVFYQKQARPEKHPQSVPAERMRLGAEGFLAWK